MLILNYYCPHCGWSDKVPTPECAIGKNLYVYCDDCGSEAPLVLPEKVKIKADEVYEVCDNDSEDIDTIDSLG